MIYIYTTLHDCRQYYRNIIRLLDYTDPPSPFPADCVLSMFTSQSPFTPLRNHKASTSLYRVLHQQTGGGLPTNHASLSIHARPISWHKL